MTSRTRPRRTRAPSSSNGQLVAMSMAMPFVMATRMSGMWLNALKPSARGDRENTLMVTEKVAASLESVAAAQAEVMRQSFEQGMRLMTGAQHMASLDMDKVLNVSLKPYSKRVAANARRLGR
jgi:hypothetical protein